MEEICESVSEDLNLSIDDETPKSPKSLLDLPDDLLLLVLGQVPFDLFAHPSLCPLRDLRLVCKRFNNITRAEAFYRDVAQTSFSGASALFFFESSEANLRNTIALDYETFRQFTRIRQCTSDDQPQSHTLKCIIVAGLQLLLWLRQHAMRPGNESAIVRLVLDMAEKGQLDFPAIIAIRIALIHMFQAFALYFRGYIFDYARFHVNLGTRSAEEIQHTLFLAFESVLLCPPRSD